MKTTQKILMALVSLTLCLMLASCKATTSPPGSGVSELIPPDGGTDREIDEKTDEETDEEISEEISEEDADINVPDKNKLASDLNRLRNLLKSSYAQAITAIGSVAFTNRPGELAVYLETSGIDGTELKSWGEDIASVVKDLSDTNVSKKIAEVEARRDAETDIETKRRYNAIIARMKQNRSRIPAILKRSFSNSVERAITNVQLVQSGPYYGDAWDLSIDVDVALVPLDVALNNISTQK